MFVCHIIFVIYFFNKKLFLQKLSLRLSLPHFKPFLNRLELPKTGKIGRRQPQMNGPEGTLYLYVSCYDAVAFYFNFAT